MTIGMWIRKKKHVFKLKSIILKIVLFSRILISPRFSIVFKFEKYFLIKKTKFYLPIGYWYGCFVCFSSGYLIFLIEINHRSFWNFDLILFKLLLFKYFELHFLFVFIYLYIFLMLNNWNKCKCMRNQEKNLLFVARIK